MLPKEKKRRNRQHNEEEPNRNAKPVCRNSPLTTFTRHFGDQEVAINGMGQIDPADMKYRFI